MCCRSGKKPQQADQPFSPVLMVARTKFAPAMDIVKRAHGSIGACSVAEKQVRVAGRSYPGDTPVDFPTKKTKPYSLDAIVFYLLNRELSLVAYVEQCKRQGISQVAYLDRVSIENDINNYAELKIPGFFIKPVYTRRKAYDIPYLGGFYYIIVPSDVASPININTAAPLLSSSPSQPSWYADNPLFELRGHTFRVCDEPALLKDSDWRGVRAIFLNNTADQIRGWENRFYEAAKKAAVFSFSDEPFRCTKIGIKDDRIVNYEEVCERIEQSVDV